MDIKMVKGKLRTFTDKYKYVFVVILAGIALMLLPARTSDTAAQTPQEEQQTGETETVEKRLSDLLSKVDGAGKVEVMITAAAGEEIIYQTDTSASTGENTSTMQSDTITVSDAQRVETGLIKQVNPPRYQGAVVVCEGADSPTVRLAIVDAVAKITGLGADRISVMKMK